MGSLASPPLAGVAGLALPQSQHDLAPHPAVQDEAGRAVAGQDRGHQHQQQGGDHLLAGDGDHLVTGVPGVASLAEAVAGLALGATGYPLITLEFAQFWPCATPDPTARLGQIHWNTAIITLCSSQDLICY